MRQVTDPFLLLIAEASSGLSGLFLVGVFFYIETGFRRSARTGNAFQSYIKASTRIVLLLFGTAIGLSLTLVVMDPVWPRLLMVLLSAALVAANVDTATRVGGAAKATGSTVLLFTEIVGTVAVAGIVAVPWIFGGFNPGRSDLTWSILLSFGTGLLSIFAIVMSIFDVAQLETGNDDVAPGDANPGC